EMTDHGDLLLPVAIIPHRIHIADTPPFALSLIVALASAALISMLCHFLVFRPLRSAPILAKVVATVGVLITLQSLVVLQLGGDGRVVNPILPSETIKVAGISFPRDRLWLASIVTIMGLVLWAYFKFSKIGLATRAGAENEQNVALAGFSPQFLAGLTWLISGLAIGLVLILASPTTPLNPANYTLAVVPALAAALIARLQSIGVAVFAGLALGSFQSVIQFTSSKTWWPMWARTGITDAVPFIVIVLVLFFVGRLLPNRGSLKVDPLPKVGIPTTKSWHILLWGLAGILAMALLGGGYRFGLMTSLTMSMITLSVLVLTGLVGQISLTQAALAGSSGFLLSKLADGAGIPFPFSGFLAVLITMVIGVIIGIPALRIRGAQLAIVTLASGVALEKFIFRNSSFSSSEGNKIPDPNFLGLNLGVRAGRNIARFEFGFLVVVALMFAVYVVINLIRSGTGRRFLAVRSNERAAASVGINVALTKLQAFAIASGLAGMGGCFIGYGRGQLSAESFTWLVGVSILVYAYLGGITSVSGAIVGGLIAPLGIVFVVVDRNLNLGNSYSLLAGIGLITQAVFNPTGISGAIRENFARWRSRRNREVAAGDQESPASNPKKTPVERINTVTDSEILRTYGLSVHYGGVVANDSIDLVVKAGQIVGLIGPNGAGKTTFIDAISGFTPFDGRVEFDGHALNGSSPHQIARMGLRRTWQSVELFGDVSVTDNLRVSKEPSGLKAILRDLLLPRRSTEDLDITAALETVGLSSISEKAPSELSLGQQKLLGVARTLVAEPSLLLLDEPAAGLSTSETESLGYTIVDIANKGTSILLIDHDMDLVFATCDFLYVLDFGRIIASGTPKQISNDPAVLEAYLGQAEE
ncbi:MAG: hypothetical protein RL119_740, partial [Actinomycetota bacterium]